MMGKKLRTLSLNKMLLFLYNKKKKKKTVVNLKTLPARWHLQAHQDLLQKSSFLQLLKAFFFVCRKYFFS